MAEPGYSDATVTPLNTYYYRVVSASDLGETGSSPVVVTATPAAAPLPPGWSAAAIGPSGSSTGVDITGAAGYASAGDTFTLIGAGAGVSLQPVQSSPVDSFRFIFRHVTGDTSITARIAFQKPPRESVAPGGAMAGVMIRDGVGGGSQFVFAGESTQSFSGTQYRRTGVQASNFMTKIGSFTLIWVRLVRQGNTVQIYSMYDGSWESWGSVSMPLPSTLLVGLAAWAGAETDLSVARFDNVVVVGSRAPRFESFPTWPAVLDGTEVALATLGSDDAGEEHLTYTWTVTGAPAGARFPTFSDNNTNAARAVTATFHQAGAYTFRVTITNPQGLSASWNFGFTVVPTLSRLDVTPQGVPVHVRSTVRYAAAPVDQFGRPYEPPASEPPPQVAWSASRGKIDDEGNYTASEWAPAGWWDRVTATAGDISSTTDVYVYDETSGPTLLSAVSRKAHGRRGLFDLPLLLYGGPPTVEPRRGGPTILRFTFSTNVVADGGGPFGPDNFVLTNASFLAARASGDVLTLELTDVADGSVVGVALTGLSDPAGNPIGGNSDVLVRAKLGDVDGDGTVGPLDLLALRARLRRPLATPALIYDLDLDGSATVLDLVQARKRAESVHR